MRKNKDLDKYFQSFIDDLTLLFEDSNNIFSTNYKKLLKTLKEMDRIAEKTGQIDGKTESRGKNRNVKKLANLPEDLDELIYLLNKKKKEHQSLNRGIWLATNANFIYAFSLFEKFVSQVVRLKFKKDKYAREKYISYFEDFAIKKHEKEKNDSFLRRLKSNTKMLESLDELPSPLALCILMLKINTKDDSFELYNLDYKEAKERRNLLVHRGVYLDDRYIKNLKKQFGKDGQKADKYIANIKSYYSLKSREAERLKISDLSISGAYLNRYFRTLYYFSSMLYVYSFKLTSEEIANNELFLMHNIHDLLFSNFKVNSEHIYTLVLIIYKSYVDNILNGDWSKMALFDKVNWLLSINQLSETTSEDYNIDARQKLILESFPKEFEIHKKILIAHLENDVEKMLSLIPKLLKDHDLPKNTIKQWFVFQKFFKKKKFANFVENL